MELVYEFHQELLAATAPCGDDDYPRKHKVRFAAEEAIESTQESPLARVENWDELWYSTEELHGFKAEAREILYHRANVSEDDLRGLERYNYERAQWKRQTNRYILAAYPESRNNADFLALVCKKYSKWARDVARDQGERDAFQAGTQHRPQPEPIEQSSGKRPIGDAVPELRNEANGEQRRVRQRLG